MVDTDQIEILARAVVNLSDVEAEIYATKIAEIRADKAHREARRIARLRVSSDWDVINDILVAIKPDVPQSLGDDVLDTLRDAGFVRADVRAVYRTAYLRFADRVAIRPLEGDHPTYLAAVEADLKEMGLA